MESNLYFDKYKRSAPKIRDNELLLRDLDSNRKLSSLDFNRAGNEAFDPQIVNVLWGSTGCTLQSPPIIENLFGKTKEYSPK